MLELDFRRSIGGNECFTDPTNGDLRFDREPSIRWSEWMTAATGSFQRRTLKEPVSLFDSLSLSLIFLLSSTFFVVVNSFAPDLSVTVTWLTRFC